jgi:hypothetical protein
MVHRDETDGSTIYLQGARGAGERRVILQLPLKKTFGGCSNDPTDDEDDDFSKDNELEWDKVKRKYEVDNPGESSNPNGASC